MAIVETVPPEFRTCAVCTKFSIDFGSQCYSELTPGSAGVVTCEVDYELWQKDNGTPTELEFYRLIAQAKYCPFYEQRIDKL